MRGVALAAAAVVAGTPMRASVVVTPATAAARPTTVTLTLRGFPLVCGRATFGTIAVTFPAAEHVPSRIPADAVRVADGYVRSVRVTGRTVTVALAPTPPGGVICQSITMGRLTVKLMPAAGLGNPSRAGTYTVTVRHGTVTYSAPFGIRS